MFFILQKSDLIIRVDWFRHCKCAAFGVCYRFAAKLVAFCEGKCLAVRWLRMGIRCHKNNPLCEITGLFLPYLLNFGDRIGLSVEACVFQITSGETSVAVLYITLHLTSPKSNN